jgi:hypothetical protein
MTWVVVSIDRLTDVLRAAAGMGPERTLTQLIGRRKTTRVSRFYRGDRDDHRLPELQRAKLRRPDRQGVPRCPRCKATLPWVVDAHSATFAAETTVSVSVVVDVWRRGVGVSDDVARA